MAAKKSSSKKAQKQAVKFAKQHKKAVAIFVCVVLIIIIAAVLFIYLFKPDWLKGLFGGGNNPGGPGGKTEVEQGDLADINSADLSIHFIDFKNDKAGDCTLIKVGNTEVLIDAGSTQGSAAVIKEYVNKYCTDGKLEYVIATHADQDHIAGMVGTSEKGAYNGILYSYEIGTVIRFTDSNKDLTTAAGNPTLYSRFLTAVDYAVEHDAAAYTALQCWNETDGASKKYYLDAEHKISMNILYNYYYDHKAADENDYSVCTLLTQNL
ncbi:MAG: MBL fold metallo-hydrolase, partial [Clostridia bacterium]|nr:MBL fold metallo-hydrolase [Clostridia bacterium]